MRNAGISRPSKVLRLTASAAAMASALFVAASDPAPDPSPGSAGAGSDRTYYQPVQEALDSIGARLR